MEPVAVVEPKNPVMRPHQGHSLQYFLASLAGIARALEDLKIEPPRRE